MSYPLYMCQYASLHTHIFQNKTIMPLSYLTIWMIILWCHLLFIPYSNFFIKFFKIVFGSLIHFSRKMEFRNYSLGIKASHSYQCQRFQTFSGHRVGNKYIYKIKTLWAHTDFSTLTLWNFNVIWLYICTSFLLHWKSWFKITLQNLLALSFKHVKWF